MKKATRVEYNPYTNRIEFQISESVSGPWEPLSESSDLLQYTSKDVLFSNCVSDIAEAIHSYQNIAQGQVGHLPKSGTKLEAFEAMKDGHEINAIASH